MITVTQTYKVPRNNQRLTVQQPQVANVPYAWPGTLEDLHLVPNGTDTTVLVGANLERTIGFTVDPAFEAEFRPENVENLFNVVFEKLCAPATRVECVTVIT